MEKREAKKDFIIAFWKLYEKKPIEKISVRELCEIAGYNRTTFYNYYIDIYDLLEYAIEDLTQPIKDALEKIDDIKILFEGDAIQKLVLFILKRNNYCIELLIKHRQYDILVEKMKAILFSAIRQKTEGKSLNKNIEYIAAYHFSAVFGILKHWFEADKNLKDDELVEIAYKLSSQGALTLIHDEL